MKQICFMLGHHDTPESVYTLLYNAIASLAESNPEIEFIIGSHGNFDHMAARAAIEIKKKHPVRLTLLRPYHPSTHPTPLPKGFDGSLYPFDDQKIIYRLAIPKANRYMMDHCTYLISYCHKSNGNTAKLIKYALKLEAEGKIKTILL